MGQVVALFEVAYASLRYRASGVALTIASVAISVFVLLGVEHVRQEARSGFASTVSGVDLIVGARTGEINLLLLSIFRIGNATANVAWETAAKIEDQENVDWVVPISLGDSHRRYRVVGTTDEFFTRYQYGQKQALTFQHGVPFRATTDVVIGARVAETLSYSLGDSLILSHGMADTSFTHHDQLPFSVSGILANTGTPVDNALFVNLNAIEAMHADEPDSGTTPAPQVDRSHMSRTATEKKPTVQNPKNAQSKENAGDEEHEDHEDHEGHEGHEEHADREAHQDHSSHDHPPIGTVTALLVGLDSPISTLRAQRWINEYPDEALLAILPGVALTQLWELIGNVELILLGISILVFISSLFGLNAMLLASMRERRREIEILRSIGAPSIFILGLLLIESLLIVTFGVLLAIAGLLLTIAFANGVLANELGVLLSSQIFNTSNLTALGLIYLTTLLLTLIPAWQAYAVSKSIGAGTLPALRPSPNASTARS